MRLKIGYITVISVILLNLLGSCVPTDDLKKRTILSYSKNNIEFPPTLTHCLIIPGGGCAGCVASGMNFVVSNDSCFSRNQHENMVIFTNINSLKLLKRNLGSHDIEDFFHIIDFDNIYSVDGSERIYPIILYLNNGNIESVEVQSPYSNALEKLKKDIVSQ